MKNKNGAKSFFKKLQPFVLITVGSFLIAASVNLIYDPQKISIGGFNGLSIILKEIAARLGFEVPIWALYAVLNVPVFIFAWFVLGKKFIFRTIYGVVCFTAALYLIPTYDICHGDIILAVVFGAVFDGVGNSLVFKANTTTGGTDMVAAMIRTRLRHYSMPQILFVVNALIVAGGAFTFGVRSGMYAAISIYISAKVCDFSLEGLRVGKMVYIISSDYITVAERVMNEMERGVTGISTTGMYTSEERKMLLCVIGRKELARLKAIVAEVDPGAFIIVSDVREAFGEGFEKYDPEKLS